MTRTEALILTARWLDYVPLAALEEAASEAGILEPYSTLAELRHLLRQDEEREEPPQERHKHDEHQGQTETA